MFFGLVFFFFKSSTPAKYLFSQRASTAWSDCTSTECYFSGTWAQSIFGQYQGKTSSLSDAYTQSGPSKPTVCPLYSGMLPGEAFTFVKTVTMKMKCPEKSQLWEAFSSSEIIKKQIDGTAASTPMSNLPLLQHSSGWVPRGVFRVKESPGIGLGMCRGRRGQGALSMGLGELTWIANLPPSFQVIWANYLPPWVLHMGCRYGVCCLTCLSGCKVVRVRACTRSRTTGHFIWGLKMVMRGEGGSWILLNCPNKPCCLLRSGSTLLMCGFPCQLGFRCACILTSALEPYPS